MQETQQPPVDPVDVDALLQANNAAAGFFESPVSIPSLMISMGIGLVFALVLQWHYRKFATTLSSKESFSKIFPFVLLTTLLIITVVKSSLALSLGLVGALSIVRFRTPIKEPEELAYIFICIAIGLGLGASQTWATIAGAGFTFVAVGFLSWRQKAASDKNLYLSVNWPSVNGNRSHQLAEVNGVLGQHASSCDLRRVDSRDQGLEAHYLVQLPSADRLASLVDQLQTECKVDVTFIDQGNLPIV